MATVLRISNPSSGHALRVSVQGTKFGANGQQTGEWNEPKAASIAQPLADATVTLTDTQRAVLETTSPDDCYLAIVNPSNQHALRVLVEEKRGKQWSEPARDGFVHPNSERAVLVNASRRVTIQQLPT